MIIKGRGNAGERWDHPAILLWLVLVSILLPPSQAADSDSYATSGQSSQSLTLNVYLDGSGKALVTGYAESISGLDFLNGSQFRLENDSHQLYALTAGLTDKEGDLWKLRFDATGKYNDYRVTFYLPSETSLGEINASLGLAYLLSASNESLVADVQGWDVSDPRISIDYRQPLAGGSNSQLPPPPAYPGQGTALIVLVIAAALIIAGYGFALFLQKRKTVLDEPAEQAATRPAEETDSVKEAGFARRETVPASHSDDSGSETALSSSQAAQTSSMPQITDPPESSAGDKAAPLIEDEPSAFAEIEPIGEDSCTPDPAQPSDSSQMPRSEDYAAQVISPLPPSEAEKDETASVQPSAQREAGDDKPSKREIVVSSEMEAVMQTLTARENAVMSTLISHGGRMTQAEIRYETGTPKSSLTGILISLERRKLIIKKEWGRTNIIELSDWFLSKKERS